MTMKLFKKHVVAVSVAAAIGMTAGVAQAIEVAADHTGQVLLAPLYVADASGSTDITVVNPYTDQAVFARIAFRSQVNSQEVLDFEIYLSPGDVFRGSLVNENGTAYLTSSDDSVLQLSQGNVAGVPLYKQSAADGNPYVGKTAVVPFASAANPTKVALFTAKPAAADAKLSTTDTNQVGHFEVVGIYSIAADTYAFDDAGNTVTVQRGMSKNDLFKLMNNSQDLLRALNPAKAAQITGVDPTTVQLMGEVSVNFNDGQRLNYTMTALDANDADGSGAFEDVEKVIGNPSLQVIRTVELRMGEDFASPALAYDNNDNIGVIEAALAASATFAPWESSATQATRLLVTFPTKYRHYQDDGSTTIGGVLDTGCSTQVPTGASSIYFSAPFEEKKGKAEFSLTPYDNSENTPVATVTSGVVSGGTPAAATTQYFSYEVNLYSPDFVGILSSAGITADSGWFHTNFVQTNRTNAYACTYAGLPVQVSTLKTNLVKNELTAMPTSVMK